MGGIAVLLTALTLLDYTVGPGSSQLSGARSPLDDSAAPAGNEPAPGASRAGPAAASRAWQEIQTLSRLRENAAVVADRYQTMAIPYAEMMAEGLAGHITPEQKDYLTTILGKADQLLGLITSVLDVSSLESGQLALERTQLSLAELVANEVATFQAQAGRRGIAIQLETVDDSMVIGDKRKIRQVVSSLLSNAVKFTPDRGNVGVAVRRGPLGPADSESSRPPAVQLVVVD